jgi:TatD DNase family protein
MEETFYTVDFGVNFASSKRYPENKLKTLLEESWNNGVESVVCISNSIKESKNILELVKKYDMMYYTIGIHPHSAKEFVQTDIKFIESQITNSKCFGVGECGLDYNRMFSPKEKQIEVFEYQIDIAKKFNTNLYLHCRDAYDDFIKILKEKNYFKGLVHCFTGTLSQALELTSLGFKLGITGWLVDKRRNQDLVKVVSDKRIKLEMLVVETDAPFMPIYPAKESIPSDTGYIIEEIAKLKNVNFITCGKIIYSNSIGLLNK